MVSTSIKTLDTRTIKVADKVGDPFYASKPWRSLLSEIYRERGYRCEDPVCSAPRKGGRIYGDHIVELRDGGAPLDKRNVLLRCASCHVRKTAAERAKRMAARG